MANVPWNGPFDDFVNFFFRMELLVNGRSAHEVIVREGMFVEWK